MCKFGHLHYAVWVHTVCQVHLTDSKTTRSEWKHPNVWRHIIYGHSCPNEKFSFGMYPWSWHESDACRPCSVHAGAVQLRVMCCGFHSYTNKIRGAMRYVSLSVAPVEHARLIKWLEELAKSWIVSLPSWSHGSFTLDSMQSLVMSWNGFVVDESQLFQIFSYVGAFDFPCYARSIPFSPLSVWESSEICILCSKIILLFIKIVLLITCQWTTSDEKGWWPRSFWEWRLMSVVWSYLKVIWKSFGAGYVKVNIYQNEI